MGNFCTGICANVFVSWLLFSLFTNALYNLGINNEPNRTDDAILTVNYYVCTTLSKRYQDGYSNCQPLTIFYCTTSGLDNLYHNLVLTRYSCRTKWTNLFTRIKRLEALIYTKPLHYMK